MAGEIFFRNVERLLGRNDSEPLADLLEVHQLCWLLGFRGRFSASGIGEVRSILAQIEEKIRRIRGGLGPLSPPSEASFAPIAPPGDRVLRSLTWGAIACWSLALILFAIFFLALNSGTGDLQSIAARISL